MGAIVASASDFLTGFHDALRVGSGIALAGAIVATLAIRNHAGQPVAHAQVAEAA